eukprot:CAMPEP_0173171280 /NCGR_PEP_ID=MMETSP1141-20130122/1679_1 /TAXON_ID=483371 /ORGANISM="non described non described, Strain CCMP2298" /LENGTH=190 /DNA_ID=CAMNT_0014093215 /DNA_START=153 /DNA_END=725 /DNA_ORIENTATION=+
MQLFRFGFVVTALLLAVLFQRFAAEGGYGSKLAVTAESAAESMPTSQPTTNYVAPSVPEDEVEPIEPISDMPGEIGGSTNTPTYTPTPSPTHGSTPSPTHGSKAELTEPEQLEEDNQTAITSASYIFYTFILLLLFIFGTYFYKRSCGGAKLSAVLTGPQGAAAGSRYQPVHSQDPDEFFSQRNIELTGS